MIERTAEVRTLWEKLAGALRWFRYGRWSRWLNIRFCLVTVLVRASRVLVGSVEFAVNDRRNDGIWSWGSCFLGFIITGGGGWVFLLGVLVRLVLWMGSGGRLSCKGGCCFSCGVVFLTRRSRRSGVGSGAAGALRDCSSGCSSTSCSCSFSLISIVMGEFCWSTITFSSCWGGDDEGEWDWGDASWEEVWFAGEWSSSSFSLVVSSLSAMELRGLD